MVRAQRINLRCSGTSHSFPITTNIPGNVKVKISLEQAMKAQRGSRGIALLFL
jgi:hypothetical protein